MKKFLALTTAVLLTLSLLTACSKHGDSTTNGGMDTTNPAKATKEVIRVSALISKEDATDLLGQSMEDSDVTERSFIDQNHYVSKDCHFNIALRQEALHDKNSDFEKNLLKNGWTSYLKQMEDAYTKNYHNQNITKIDGIPGTSYLQDGEVMGLWLLHIFYGDYYIVVDLSNTSISKVDSEEEILRKHEKLKTAGNLAVENLKTRLGL